MVSGDTGQGRTTVCLGMARDRGSHGYRNDIGEFPWGTNSDITLEFQIVPMQSRSLRGRGVWGIYLTLLQRICISTSYKTFEVALKLHLNVLYLHPIHSFTWVVLPNLYITAQMPFMLHFPHTETSHFVGNVLFFHYGYKRLGEKHTGLNQPWVITCLPPQCEFLLTSCLLHLLHVRWFPVRDFSNDRGSWESKRGLRDGTCL